MSRPRISLNIQALLELAHKAPPLHHWTRFAAVENLVSRQSHEAIDEEHVTTSPSSPEKQLLTAKRNYAILDNFFQANGFPELPSTSKVSKAWTRALNKHVKEAPRKKQKTSKTKPVSN